MIEFFLSPIPIVLAFLLFLFGSDFIKSKLLSKMVRYISIGVFVSVVYFLLNSVNEKAIDGRLGYRTMLIKSVTYHVEKLLHENNLKEAEQIIQEFNQILPMHSDRDKKLESWMKKKNIPINQYMFNEIENIGQLQNTKE